MRAAETAGAHDCRSRMASGSRDINHQRGQAQVARNDETLEGTHSTHIEKHPQGKGSLL